MKKGIIIVLITLISILSGYNKVNASDIFMNNWADGLPNISRVDIRGCDKEIYSSTFDTYQCDNNSSELDSVRSYYSTGSGFREYVQNSYAWTIGTNGYSVGTASRTKKNYLYQVNYYYCSSTWVNDYTDTFITMGAHAQKNQDAIYYTDLMQFVGNQPGAYNENYTNYYKGDWTACYRLTALIVPKSDSANINFRIRQTSGTISNYYHQFISLEVNELGLWSGALENVIENSGFAKATDVQQVETAVNEVKQEVQELNNSIDETNDILTGEQDYNTNASEEVNGKQEIDDYTEKEEQLFSSLDFEGIENSEIIINPNASSFIWQIVEGLRGISGKIVLLMTSILGLGIIKMVLNR